jgi:hypothetical protein
MDKMQRGKLGKHYLLRYHQMQSTARIDDLLFMAEKVRFYDSRNTSDCFHCYGGGYRGVPGGEYQCAACDGYGFTLDERHPLGIERQSAFYNWIVVK